MTLYNEFDPKAAAWLRELIAQGHLPAGTVDERSIEELTADDCADAFHAFAGIGGWPLALHLAGWTDPDVWTGSCPCQPFSAAGKQDGVEDERHLWPVWFRLIAELRPRTIFGEQVTGAVGHGWLDGVFADLEAEGYTCGAVVLGAHSVGAPHIRQRLLWVADACGERAGRDTGAGARAEAEGEGGGSSARNLGDAPVARRTDGGLGDPDKPRSQGRGLRPDGDPDERAPWSHGTSLIECGDGKTRRIKSSIFPLAPRLPGDVGLLRGAGNSIVPQVAAEFIRAFMETRS